MVSSLHKRIHPAVQDSIRCVQQIVAGVLLHPRAVPLDNAFSALLGLLGLLAAQESRRRRLALLAQRN